MRIALIEKRAVGAVGVMAVVLGVLTTVGASYSWILAAAVIGAVAVIVLGILLLARGGFKQQFVRAFRPIAFGLPLVTYSFVANVPFLHRDTVPIGFYSAAAEIIPILLLGLIVEVGAVRMADQGPVDVFLNATTGLARGGTVLHA